MISNEQLISMSSKNDLNVLVTGPTGSGKTSLARSIHEKSRRSLGPFVVVNFASLHDNTLEAEIFGYEKGAFTGADSRKPGLLQQAHRGTVLLDEIGELPLKLQQKLLQFLQDRTVTPMGSHIPQRVDVRVIAATHRHLFHEVQAKNFREDLFYRLNVIPIQLQSIAEKAEGLDELIHQTLESICVRQKRKILRISADFASSLEAHTWPGNYRELNNVLEFAVSVSEGEELTRGDLPPGFAKQAFEPIDSCLSHYMGKVEVPIFLNYKKSLKIFENILIKKALNRNQGRINQTAKSLGLSKNTLLHRLKTQNFENNFYQKTAKKG